MLLYFIFLFNIFILSLIKGQPSNYSHINLNSKFFNGLKDSVHRIRREDKLKHTAVCGELDRTEDTAFIATITTRNYGRLLCMGSIIDESHVLTARNCTLKSDAGALTVIGGYQSPYFGKNSQVKYVEKILLHPKDLAILVLRKPFDITQTVKPIRVIGPEKMNELEFQNTYKEPYSIIGYEVPKSLEQADFIPKESSYHMVDEKFIAKADCKKCYDIQDEASQFCTDGKSEFGWGGMGSPVIIVLQKEFVQVGVFLKGKCTTKETKNYNLFTRVDRFYKWIKANSYIGR